MHVGSGLFVLAVSCCVQPGFTQIIETGKIPPSIVFKDASGAVASSIEVEEAFRLPVPRMVYSNATKNYYVLKTTGRERMRSIVVVEGKTGASQASIELGTANEFAMFLTNDGTRLFCLLFNGETAPVNSYGGSLPGPRISSDFYLKHSPQSRIFEIETSSNEILRTYSWFDATRSRLPEAKIINVQFFWSPHGDRLVAEVLGFKALAGVPEWQKFAIFSAENPNGVLTEDPGENVIAGWLSEQGDLLFVAAENRKGKFENLMVVDLESGKTMARQTIHDPPTRKDRLGAFLEGAAPSQEALHQGMWVYTSEGLRFLSQTGRMGNDIALPREEEVAALLSLDRRYLFMALPDVKHNSGEFDVVDLVNGTISKKTLDDAPTKLLRLGSSRSLWVISSQLMRPVAETGDLGKQAIQLNKPRKGEADSTEAASLFMDGVPGETIGLGEGHAAVLIQKKDGSTTHRIAVLDLGELRLDGIARTMSSGEQAKIQSGRFLKSLGEAALIGAVAGAAGAASGVPLNSPAMWSINNMAAQMAPVPNLGMANEVLAAPSKGDKLYALDFDDHTVSVIDVAASTVGTRIPVDKTVTRIEVLPDGKHLLCVGNGYLHTIDMDTNKVID